MPEISKHEPGMFSWADLGTTDVAAAKKFYSALFGWEWRDDPMGPGQFYSRALLGGLDVCAIYPQQEAQAKAGMPPYWASYITVTDADAIAGKATAARGTVVMPPFDVFDAGRMTVVADPSGGAIAAWQAKAHIGSRVFGDAGTLCWVELLSTNIDVALPFYRDLFGWTVEAMAMPTGGSYYVARVGGKPAAGLMAMPAQVPKHVPSYWVPYFAVADCDATMQQCVAAGGKVLAPAMEVPDVGRFGALLDPQGAAFEVLQPKR